MHAIDARKFAGRKRRAGKIIAELKRLFPSSRVFLNYRGNWELLVAVILSARCTDKKVNEVTARLFKKYRRLEDYARANQHEFERDIRETGFYRSKAKHILGSARILKERFGGRVPKTMEEMLSLPGVGRKTANIVLANAHGVIAGIPVDTHVRRLARRLHLTDESDPDKIEKDLVAVIPKKEWFGISYRLIDYGRKFCPSRPHEHAKCPLQKFEK